jgi:hypothetical protein
MPGVALDREAMDRLEALRRSLRRQGMQLVLRNLSEDQAAILEIAGCLRRYLPDGFTMASGAEVQAEEAPGPFWLWSLARGLPGQLLS